MNKVLIVDDHPVIRLAVRMLMERHGYEVIAETDNGVDALQLAREQMPDIVILDIGIPKLDGLEVIASSELDTDAIESSGVDLIRHPGIFRCAACSRGRQAMSVNNRI